jgi:hypothetical protein
MRLANPFYRLPVRFDAARLAAEVAALPATAWQPHPNQIAGNSCVRLVSVEGGENDDVNGPMQPTPHLERLPYVHQVLASFGVVWSRSRLMRLAAGADVPAHSDINHHWFYRVRLHVPVLTRPQVSFYCEQERVHMAPGEAWVFDNWRQHRVENRSDSERIHLVADTTGSSTFWQFVASGTAPGARAVDFGYDPQRRTKLLVERVPPDRIMSPAEVDLLLLDLSAELAPLDGLPDGETRLARYFALLEGFRRDWRQLYSMHGDSPAGEAGFVMMRDALRDSARPLGEGLIVRSNRVAAHAVLEGRLIRALVNPPRGTSSAATPTSAAGATSSSATAPAAPAAPAAAGTRTRGGFVQPLLLLAAPRSGSTLLFETLAASSQVATPGGESHEIIEGLAELQPGAPGVESNRLDARQASEAIVARLRERFAARLVDHAGRPVDDPARLRFVEKTPKNALRVPFLERVFPDARYVLLWRDPRESLYSIIRAWESGRWKTYAGLPGFTGPWSLLLPPGWQALEGRPLAEIAARQWVAANETALEDLAALDPARWISVDYASLVADPRRVVGRVAGFAGLAGLDAALEARLAAPLPPSKQTLTPARADKWRELESDIMDVLPLTQPVWDRLRSLP